jgi:hypothetical protein
VLVLIIEDEEVAGHDLMGATEPPPTAGQVHRDSAVEQDLRGLVAGSAAAHPQQDLVHFLFHHLRELAG